MSGPYEAGRPITDGPMPHPFPNRPGAPVSTSGRYRTAALPTTTDGYGQARISTNTCTDCGTLVLDQNTHDTWHTIQAATHLHRDDVLVLDADFNTDTEGAHRLSDLLARLGIAHRTLVVGGGVTAQVLARENLEQAGTDAGLTSPAIPTEPANPPCPDCGHDATLHTGPRSGCKAAHTTAGICGCHRTAW